MNITKMTISQETRNRIFAMGNISRSKKSDIRTDGIKQLIRSKYAGYPFKTRELMDAAGYRANQYQTAWQFIDRLFKKGIIVKASPGFSRSAYSIPEDAKLLPVKPVEVSIADLVKKASAYAPEDSKDVIVIVNDGVGFKEPQEKFQEKAHNDNPADEIKAKSVYSFEFKISKRTDSTDYGKKHVALLEINDTTISKVEYMIKELIDSIR